MGLDRFLFSFFLILCLVLPMEPGVRLLKYAILTLLLLHSLMKFLVLKRPLISISSYLFYSCLLVLFWLAIGISKGADDWLNNFEIYFLFPLIFYFIFRHLYLKLSDIIWLLKGSFFLILSQLILIYVLTVFFGIGQGHDGVIIPFLKGPFVYNIPNKEFSIPAINSLPFLLPVLYYLVLKMKTLSFYKSLGYLIFFSLVSFWTGRLGVFVVVSFVNLLIFWVVFLKRKYMMFVIFLNFLFLLILVNFFFNRLNFTQDASNISRATQFIYLLDHFYNSPLIGNGLGSHPAYIRSTVKPSSYELYHLNMLNQLGVIGYLLLFYCWFKIWKVKFRYCRILNGSLGWGITAVLISSLSNPYFDRFDFIFLLFIPHIKIHEDLFLNKT